MIDRFSSFLATRWVMLIVVLVFICCKVPHLFYPFYCDESWVYVRAVKMVAIHGPSLMPDSIPADVGRGHPLLFPFLSALWIRCFGASNVAVHSFPLLVSVLCLISIYEGCRKLFGSRAALLALLLVAANVLFFVQAAFVFPEIMLAMFAFLSLYYYVQDRLLLTAVMLSLLFFTKESGLVFGVVAGADAFISLLRGKDSMRHRLQRLAAVVLPVSLIGLFFVLQKARLGWYLLPLHTSLVHTDWNSVYYMFREGVFWIFRGDAAHYYLVFLAMLLSVVPAIKQKNPGYLFLCLPAIVVYLLTSHEVTHGAIDVLYMLSFVLFFAIAVYCLLWFNRSMTTPARRFMVLTGAGFILYLFYLSFSLVAYRYLLADVVLLWVLLAVCIDTYITAAGRYLFYTAIAGILCIGAYAFYSDEGDTDADIGVFNAMKVQQQEIAYLEKEQAYDREIVIGCYYAIGHFTDTMQGFLSSPHVFTRVKHENVSAGTDYAIFDNVCNYNDYDGIVKNPQFHLVYKIQHGSSWGAIYKRN